MFVKPLLDNSIGRFRHSLRQHSDTRRLAMRRVLYFGAFLNKLKPGLREEAPKLVVIGTPFEQLSESSFINPQKGHRPWSPFVRSRC